MRRFGEHLATFAENAQAGLDSSGQLQWLDRLDDEQANLRAIIHGASDARQLTCALRIAGALSRYWQLRDLAPELMAWLTQALAQPAARSELRARALYALGVTSAAIGERHAATLALRECLSMGGEHVDARVAALCESLLAVCLLHQGSRVEAAVHRAQALAAATVAKDLVTRAAVCLNLGGWSSLRSADDRELIAEALTLYQSLGDRVGACRAHHALGWWAMLAGDPEMARVNLEEALLAAGGVCAVGLTAEIRGHLGLLELVEGRTVQARAHLTAAVAVLSRSGRRRRRTRSAVRTRGAGSLRGCARAQLPSRSRSRVATRRSALTRGVPPLPQLPPRGPRASGPAVLGRTGLGVAASELTATLIEVSREASTVTQQTVLTLQRSTAFSAKLAASA